jgi:thymidylate kinase
MALGNAGANPVKIVSFSGIDGAGKSTQITACEKWLRESGFRTTLLTFWDDVVLFSRSREFMSYKAFKGDRGIGSPEKPLQRRDKNVTSWPVTTARLLFYLADALNLRRRVAEARRSTADVIIFDRYIYDELANLPLKRRAARFFVRGILRFVPTPDLAFVIDADPNAAHARKPEYPLEFVRRNREAYIALAGLAGNIMVVPPASVAAMKGIIQRQMLQIVSLTESARDDYSVIHPPANISSGELIEP